ncbi:leucine-rich repeat domain-containing protein [Anaerosporobacter faecicola]|uniref:leucine-rich repeat domain-containing protein n=1 Tax=Anaerosporobacter faecicola TaxID=2718714 RepID=UPI00143B753A|nr:leucine-rich repeat domain-containing protein [Anaerosporobacter faecicola]
MMNLKKMAFAVAMMVTVGTVATPVAGAQAASNCAIQTTNNCNFSKGKLNYKITGKNTCTVTGLTNKSANSTSCNIPSTVTCNGKTYKVTGIANNAFKNCDNLKSVTCSNSVKTIGSNAFANCDSLSKVTLGNSVNKVSNNAFGNCNNLKKITCKSNIKTTGSNCFGNAAVKYSR